MASGRRAPLRALLVGLGCLAVTVLVIQGTGRTNVALLSVPDENVVGSLGVQADDVAGALGALDDVSLTRRDNVNIDGVLGSVDAMKGSTSAAAMKQDMNTFFDKIPVRDVEHGNSAPRAVSRASSPWGQLEDSPEHEWAAKLKNMEAAVKIAHEKGDAALEEAVNKGLTRPGGEQAAMQSSDASMRTRAANSNRLLASMARKLGGIDGSRAKHLANDVSGLKSSLRKEHSIMSRLKAEVAVRDELKAKHSVLASEKMSTKSLEQQAHALADSVQDAAQTIASKTADLTKARTELERAEEVIRDALESNQALSIAKHDDAFLDRNPKNSEGWKYDEFTNLNPPDEIQPSQAPLPPYTGPSTKADPNQALSIAKHDDAFLDRNPKNSEGWMYDEFTNLNPPDEIQPPQAPLPPYTGPSTKASTQSLRVVKGRTSGLTRIAKKDDGYKHGASTAVLAKTPHEQWAAKMQFDEQQLHKRQQQVHTLEGTLAAMKLHAYKHQLAYEQQTKPDSATEAKWEARNQSFERKAEKLYGQVKDTLRLDDARLNADIKSMEAVKAAEAWDRSHPKAAARQPPAQAGKHISSGSVSHTGYRAERNAGKQEGSKGELGSQLGWLKKHFLSGLAEKRPAPSATAVLAARKKLSAVKTAQLAVQKGTGGAWGEPFAAARAPVTHSLAEGLGLSFCGLMGIACS